MRPWKHKVNIKQFLHAFDANNDRVCDLALKMRKELLAKLPAEWLPIETAPKDGTYILVGSRRGSWVAKYKPVFTSGYRPSNPWASMMLNHDHIGEQWPNPTHWMPLPAAPTTAELPQPEQKGQ